MSALEINVEALRGVYAKVSFGCLSKSQSQEYSIKRLSAELD